MSLTWDPKDPDDIDDFAVLWGDRLVGGDQLSSATFSVVSGSVVIGDSGYTATEATVWLSGGTADETCEVLCRVTTAGGRQYDRTVKLKIKAK